MILQVAKLASIPLVALVGAKAIEGKKKKRPEGRVLAVQPVKKTDEKKGPMVKARVVMARLKPVKKPRPSGPLPRQAIEAYESKRHGRGRRRTGYKKGVNDIHERGAWFYFGSYSQRWFRKLKKLRFYSDPPGALFLRSTDKAFNLAWMMRCRPDMYPGVGKAKHLNVRCEFLRPWLSPKADWDTFAGYFKDNAKEIPNMLKTAGVVGGAVASGGMSVASDPQGQLASVTDAIVQGLKPIGNVGRSVKKRLRAADVVIGEIGEAYLAQLKAANPWIVREDGTIDIGKNYKKNPKTYEDLFEKTSGYNKGSYPLLFNPE